MRQIIYLTLDNILHIHETQIEEFGGSHGLRDLGLLESALFRPQTTFGGEELYPTIFLKAACLMQSLVLNHPFVDGNKRTGTVATLAFLELNGFVIGAEQKELEGFPLKVESKEWKIEEIAEWLERSVVEV